MEKIAQTGYCADYIIRPDEVIEALCRLKANKNDGGEGLSTNHFKFAGGELTVHLAFCFLVFWCMGLCLMIFINVRRFQFQKARI